MQNDNDLFYLCSLIEFLGRQQKLKRGELVHQMGTDTLRHIYDYADVLHCEPIAAVADQYVELCQLGTGSFDNVSDCQYTVPDYWTIGEVYARLITDVMADDVILSLEEVYGSWLSLAIDNYNSDLFYQPRDYLAACYREGMILDD